MQWPPMWWTGPCSRRSSPCNKGRKWVGGGGGGGGDGGGKTPPLWKDSDGLEGCFFWSFFGEPFWWFCFWVEVMCVFGVFWW